jgi:hypothetical protein
MGNCQGHCQDCVCSFGPGYAIVWQVPHSAVFPDGQSGATLEQVIRSCRAHLISLQSCGFFSPVDDRLNAQVADLLTQAIFLLLKAEHDRP